MKRSSGPAGTGKRGGGVAIDATVGVRTQHYVHDVVPLGGSRVQRIYADGAAFKFEAGSIEGRRAS